METMAKLSWMPTTAEDTTTKLRIYLNVTDEPDILVPAYPTPPKVNDDGIDHILVTLNQANKTVATALEQSDYETIMREVVIVLSSDMYRWQHHYPVGRIRSHIWLDKTPEESASLPGFFYIDGKPSPFLQAVAKLPIFGDAAELAQFDQPR